MAREWSFTRQAEADLTASRETIEELLIVNTRHAEQARLAVATQAATVSIRSGAVIAGKMRHPRGTSSAVENSRHLRSRSSSNAAVAATISLPSADVAPRWTRRTLVSTVLTSSDESDDDVMSLRPGQDAVTGD